MAMPGPPLPPPPPPPFNGPGAGAHRLVTTRARNFKSAIHNASGFITQYPVLPPAGQQLAIITNQVDQFLSEARFLAEKGLLTPAQIAYCDYFRQLWLNHNAWWQECVNAMAQLQAMAL
jgi:hypothetical protein